MNPASQNLASQRMALLLCMASYLFFFRTIMPSGDALVYLNHVREGSLIWNPNHLLMDPVAYLWSKTLGWLGITEDGVTALKVLSGLSALVAIAIFDMVLVEAGIKSFWARAAGMVGLFASRNFLTMALSEEFFMIQMPLLSAVLLMLVRYCNGGAVEQRYAAMWRVGVLLALTTAISVNNVFLILGMAAAIVLQRRYSSLERYGAVWRLGVSSLVVGVSLFGAAYVLSGTGAGFVGWLTAYQGNTDNPIAGLYGIQWRLSDVVISLNKIGFNLLANFVDFGPLGTLLKSVAFGLPLEIRVNWLLTLVGGLLAVAVFAALIRLTIWVAVAGWRLQIVRFGLAWILSYGVFNLYWNDSSDQFWFQLLPVMWLMLLLPSGAASGHATNGSVMPSPGLSRGEITFGMVPVLLVVNTALVAAPGALVDYDRYLAEHRQLIRAGDLEIIPGWDGLRWLGADETYPGYEQVTLMQLATGRDGDGKSLMESLPQRVRERLNAGNRVFVARLYDRDDKPRPWDNLRKLGWPRERIQALLGEFDTTRAISIGGIVIREVRLRE